MTLGPLLPEAKPAPSWVWGLGLAAGVALAAWWYSPCPGPECAIERYRGFPPKVISAAQAFPEEAEKLYQKSRILYPYASWPLLQLYKNSNTLDEKIRIAKELIQEFPYANVNYYISLYKMYLSIGWEEKAFSVRQSIQRIFPNQYNSGRLK